jgi:hypothetical protein
MVVPTGRLCRREHRLECVLTLRRTYASESLLSAPLPVGIDLGELFALDEACDWDGGEGSGARVGWDETKAAKRNLETVPSSSASRYELLGVRRMMTIGPT